MASFLEVVLDLVKGFRGIAADRKSGKMSGGHGPPERFLSELLEGIVCNHQDKIELLNGLFWFVWSFNIYVKMVYTHTIKFYKHFIKMRNEAKDVSFFV